jgi:large subunit ribosomal protein L7/L12
MDNKLDEIISKVSELKVTELAELVKKMEEKFGVSAAMPMAGPSAGSGQAAEAEEKTSFDVVITEAGGQKIQVIKALREALGIGLQEAKAMTEGTPKTAKAGMKKEEAEELKKKLEAAGAKVELK